MGQEARATGRPSRSSPRPSPLTSSPLIDQPGIIIVGAGLAGASAAAHLARDHRVMVLEASAPGSAASGAAAGLVNPFPGLRAASAWRFAEALEALDELIDRAGEDVRHGGRGLLRPARDTEQAEWFAERARAHPDELTWLERDAVNDRWPSVSALYGGLWVARGAAVDTDLLIKQLLEGVELRSGVRVASVGEGGSLAWVITADGERINARAVILAPGDGFRHFPQLSELPLGRLKGQTLRVAQVRSPSPLPHLAGDGYVVNEGRSLLLGSTYERSFDHVGPTDAGAREILRKTSSMVPALEDADILAARAGVRVTVPARVSKRRLPLVGLLPGHRRVWAFVGLGSKGLLTAPLMAKQLAGWMRIPYDAHEGPELRIERALRT